jgi:hypothetical protein
MSRDDAFVHEALVDFIDDALVQDRPVTPEQIDAMMATLKGLGVRRVSWGYYADGRGGLLVPHRDTGRYPRWTNCAATFALLGDPLRVATAAAHRHGLELYAYYKPYETGPGVLLPEGSPEAMSCGRLARLGGRLACLDRFVLDHPHLRVRRRPLPTSRGSGAVRELRLVKRDAAPTRITREHLQIWTSRLNYRYQRRDVPFALTDTVEPAAEDVRNFQGQIITRRGDPVRVLTLSGFALEDPFILITTDFTGGPADFVNAGTAMVQARDGAGRAIIGSISNHWNLYNQDQLDFRGWGVVFDHGGGLGEIALDEPSAAGNRGFIAFTPGRNEYLPGALCETEPEVAEFWLGNLRDMLDAGVDGVDFREENHSSLSDYCEDYGWNPAVLARCAALGSADAATVARVRGDAYTGFLRRAKALIGAYGKRMRINFQLDWYRREPVFSRRSAYPANLVFDWRRWIEEGLVDEAVIRVYGLPFSTVFSDELGDELIGECRRWGIPVVANRYINEALQQRELLVDEHERLRRDGRFAGMVFYETGNFLKFETDGRYRLLVDEIRTCTANAAR